MRLSLRQLVTAARAQGADEGTRDAAALAGRRSLVRRNSFPEGDRAARFAAAIAQMHTDRDLEPEVGPITDTEEP